MDKKELGKINLLTFNYLSLIGLYNDEKLDSNNIIIKYFFNNIYNKDINDIKDIDNINDIINEFYRIYKKLEDILINQDEKYKMIISQIINDNVDYYIEEIIKQYKDNLFELILNIDNNNLYHIKINILNDKMLDYAKNEEYEKANDLKIEIEKIKGFNLN
ncbi:UvrB/UvrC motif-containing protein [Trichloromonas sp.]|uniref:UvrB/UvrC motif-containing protein n=1 Tax=Trichloromonas sp. TaxID=3069249 RepID=UPI002A3D00CB|nr:hypothetical protein [Trichloromonas sp.]